MVVIPVVNDGSDTAINVLIVNATLDSDRPSKLAVPWSLGDIAPAKDHRALDTLANLSFSLDGLHVGEAHLVTVKGTYQHISVTHGFTLEIPVKVPELDPRENEFQLLAARVQVAIDEKAGLWTYTLLNDEAASDYRFINLFQLRMAAPFAVTGTPQGWSVQTDNRSFVLWHVDGESGRDIAPGASLTGFQVQSASKTSEGMVYSLSSWNHRMRKTDLTGLGTILTPARQR